MNDGWSRVLGKSFCGFVMVAITLTFAAGTAPVLSRSLQLSPDQLQLFRLFALGMVAWGVLGRSGWEIQSWKGQNPYEKFNSRWFTALYLLGLFFGALGLLMESADAVAT